MTKRVAPKSESVRIVRKLRCAVYTRKSSEEGLEQEFNSLDAQREACEAYIASQKAEGWLLLGDRYDDGGFSGGTLERPALRRLLKDIEAHRVDVVVVYKIDRLSRSLMDFARLVEVFDRTGVTFVSVTQSFNTTTSMGRLTLNVLLSFAQFEREVIGERIRDKFAASRRKGMWMGGFVPLGYDVRDRKLVINEAEAKIVRMIFERFAKIGSATTLTKELLAAGVTGKRGKPLDKGALYKLLNNRVYVGEAVHKGTAYPGEHQAIVSRALWDRIHNILQQSPRTRAAHSRAQTPALLKGLLFGADGAAMSPTHTRKGGKLYRYYVSQSVLKHGRGTCDVGRVPAGEIEAAVIGQVRRLLATPEIIVRTWRAARQQDATITEAEVRDALHRFLEHRIADRRLLRLIGKWLKGGVLEDGRLLTVERGTPQGAVISPVLANIYLHYVYDLWVHQWRKQNDTGEVIVVRYADDIVVGFQRRSDAERFLDELRQRLKKFGLELHPQKTRIIEFGRFAERNRKAQGLGKPETFAFLGFTHICGTNKGGGFLILRHTIRKRLREKIRQVKEAIGRMMHRPIAEQALYLKRVMNGFFNYFAVPTNTRAINAFYYHVTWYWCRALRRRSQNSPLTWQRMKRLIDHSLPPARLRHPLPDVRFSVMTRGGSPVR